MIKLNNKNITYVALADSSNSIKAPKEIWYADSNNSVKLVYRRKDALIEGEDYEKYHWLQGRNGAYINTEHLVKTYEDAFEVYAKYDGITRNPDGKGQDLFGIRSNNITFTSYIDSANNINAVIKQNENYSNYSISIHKEVFKLTLYAPNSSEYVKILDGISYTNPMGGTVANDTNLKMYVFTRNGLEDRYFHGDISYFKITDSTFVTNKLHLVPCKLLKPVPKRLDANGIRRQVGECGMIDLVSGKFYGNVNNVGTFTVENYYERKEWLETDLPITATTYMELPVDSVTFSFNRIFERVVNSTLFVTTRYSYYIDKISNDSDSTFVKIWDIPNAQEVFRATTPIVIGELISINSTASELSVNNETIPIYENTNITIKFRQAPTSSELKSKFKTSVITVDGIERYIPCTLTMDLPAYMDANNIPRTKGTSGMWDKVSGRFFGNVASSGTFKAVNLAEGVDYEVYDWLKTELVGTNARMMILPVHSYSFSFSRKMTSGKNVPYFYTEGSTPSSVYLNTTNNHTIQIWDSTQGLYYSSGQSFDRNDAVSIVSTIDGLKVNSQSIPQNTFPVQSISFGANDTNGTENYTSSITVDDIERYIPVKLLKSIPAKYDANGIARQAGECGMYDTVNDVFYGNVANSGTFSVSDDS